MTTHSAQVVAREIRKRLPGLPVKKLHKLLYYCQGYHVAALNEPLFPEAIVAWDMGPVVAELWWSENHETPTPDQSGSLGEAELNTIGYVVSRYGKLSGLELERLTHAETPWIEADAERRRHNLRSHRIAVESIARHVADQMAAEGDDIPVDPVRARSWIAKAADRAQAGPVVVDTPDALLARLR